jgi:hypothetical protein
MWRSVETKHPLYMYSNINQSMFFIDSQNFLFAQLKKQITFFTRLKQKEDKLLKVSTNEELSLFNTFE